MKEKSLLPFHSKGSRLNVLMTYLYVDYSLIFASLIGCFLPTYRLLPPLWEHHATIPKCIVPRRTPIISPSAEKLPKSGAMVAAVGKQRR